MMGLRPCLDVFRIVGVSCVVGSDWHDPCGQQVVVPVERVVGAVTKHPDRFLDGERVTIVRKGSYGRRETST